MTVHDGGVGNQVVGHGIEDYVVIFFLQLLDHLVHVLTQEQRGGVGRNGTNADDVESLMERATVNHIVKVFLFTRQVSGDT